MFLRKIISRSLAIGYSSRAGGRALAAKLFAHNSCVYTRFTRPMVLVANRLQIAGHSQLARTSKASLSTCDVLAQKTASTSNGGNRMLIKEQLFYLEWLTDVLVPRFLKQKELSLQLLQQCTEDVLYDDVVFDKLIKGIDLFARHVTRVQVYLTFSKGTCKFDKLGSYMDESDGVLVVLWRMTASQLYGTGIEIVEGAMSFHLNDEGKIHKIKNDKIRVGDRDGAKLFAKCKEAALIMRQTRQGPNVETSSIWRFLTRLAVPSSALVILTRTFCSRTGKNGEKPELHHLEHIRHRLEMTVPLLFQQHPDYTIFRKDLIYMDETSQTKIIGRDKFVYYMGFITVMCQLGYPHIEMEPLTIVSVVEDGTVRMRWRIKHISWLRAIFNPKMFDRQYRLKNVGWHDGYTIFYVDCEGMVHKVVTRRVIEDEYRHKRSLTELAQKVGVLPKGTAVFSFLSLGKPDEQKKQ